MKQNKKGFTLAELLIVVAIIAILIAIAIPIFAGALNNAKIQTDHANMRSAYAMAQSATLQGVLFIGEEGTDKIDVTIVPVNTKYYFMPDGTLQEGTDAHTNSYKLKANANSDDCKASIPCKASGIGSHTVGKSIYLIVNSDRTVSVGLEY